jgi:hypothetical protein
MGVGVVERGECASHEEEEEEEEELPYSILRFP